jgi:endonuclease/exonuclease/phosphatase (EEP) superfamily protein YafD
MDLWTPTAWRASTANRQLRRAQLEAALQRDSSQQNLPEILGGDFNAPVSDSVFQLLSGFQDAHVEAGRGWGNTAVNSLPIARPDRIWLRQIDAVSVRAKATRYSDHRLVVADLVISH